MLTNPSIPKPIQKSILRSVEKKTAFLRQGCLTFLIFFTSVVGSAEAAWNGNAGTGGYLDLGTVVFSRPDAATQAQLVDCFTNGVCAPDTDIRIYPQHCQGSGTNDCTGCYVLQGGSPNRVGDLSSAGDCSNITGYPDAQKIAVFVGYQRNCPNGVDGSGTCSDGQLLLSCRISSEGGGSGAQQVASYNKDCFAGQAYPRRAKGVSATVTILPSGVPTGPVGCDPGTTGTYPVCLACSDTSYKSISGSDACTECSSPTIFGASSVTYSTAGSPKLSPNDCLVSDFTCTSPAVKNTITRTCDPSASPTPPAVLCEAMWCHLSSTRTSTCYTDGTHGNISTGGSCAAEDGGTVPCGDPLLCAPATPPPTVQCNAQWCYGGKSNTSTCYTDGTSSAVVSVAGGTNRAGDSCTTQNDTDLSVGTPMAACGNTTVCGMGPPPAVCALKGVTAVEQPTALGASNGKIKGMVSGNVGTPVFYFLPRNVGTMTVDPGGLRAQVTGLPAGTYFMGALDPGATNCVTGKVINMAARPPGPSPTPGFTYVPTTVKCEANWCHNGNSHSSTCYVDGTNTGDRAMMGGYNTIGTSCSSQEDWATVDQACHDQVLCPSVTPSLPACNTSVCDGGSSFSATCYNDYSSGTVTETVGGTNSAGQSCADNHSDGPLPMMCAQLMRSFCSTLISY